MGGIASSVQQPQTGGGKGGAIDQAVDLTKQTVQKQEQQQYQPPQPMGKGGYTNSATSGQPRIGQQNQYSNTVGQWDNSQIQPVQRQGGKGKGA